MSDKKIKYVIIEIDETGDEPLFYVYRELLKVKDEEKQIIPEDKIFISGAVKCSDIAKTILESRKMIIEWLNTKIKDVDDFSNN